MFGFSECITLSSVVLCLLCLATLPVIGARGRASDTQCYEELGCFSNGPPWSAYLPPPQKPTDINTRLICYTRSSNEGHNITLWPKIALNDCPFSAEKPTVILYHGWCIFSSVEFCISWMINMKNVYLEKVDANVFLVEWLSGAETTKYHQVASNCRIVGAEVARFIKHLQKEWSFDPAKLHLIGNSLGPHAAAFTAKHVQDVGRITALDAAQPIFEGMDVETRLDKSDALFVDMIHTSSSPTLSTGGFGIMAPYGHVDFYINGGYKQPECDVTPESASWNNTNIVLEWAKTRGCSHNRAIQLFTEALKNDNCTFWGHPATTPQPVFKRNWRGRMIVEEIVTNVTTCDVTLCVPLGLHTPHYPARGSFVVDTTVDCSLNNLATDHPIS